MIENDYYKLAQKACDEVKTREDVDLARSLSGCWFRAVLAADIKSCENLPIKDGSVALVREVLNDADCMFLLGFLAGTSYFCN